MRNWKALMSCVVLGTATLGAMAQDNPQPGGGGGGGGGRGGQPRQPQMSPEKAKAAWELQAKSVAASLGLNADQTKAVVKAYSEARTTHGAASEKLRQELVDRMREGGGEGGGGGGGGGGGREMQQKLEELTTAERTKLQKALGASLNEEQTKKAMVSLGGFNRQWDTMADALAGLSLEPKKLDEAMKATQDYVIAVTKARDSDDQEAMRATMQEARQKLNDSLKKTLGDEAFAKYEAAMPRGRGGQGGPGGGGGGRGGEGGGGGGGQPPRRGGGGGGGGGGAGGGGF